MTTILNWQSGVSGTWESLPNWNGLTIPNFGTDAFITVPGTYTVTITAPGAAAHALTIDNPTATLLVQQDLVYGDLHLDAGRLQLSATGILKGGFANAMVIAPGAVFRSASGTLDTVTVWGALTLDDANSGLNLIQVKNGLVLKDQAGTGSGTLNLTGPSAEMRVLDNETIALGTINMGGAGTTTWLTQAGTTALTLGAGVTLHHLGGTANVSGAAQFLTSQGQITADAGNGVMAINSKVFTNSGTITVDNGDRLDINTTFSSTAFVNQAGGVVSVGGNGSLFIGGGSWTNAGTVQVVAGAGGAGGKVYLGSNFTTAALSNVTRETPTTGRITIYATDDNTGATLDLGTGTSLGSVVLGFGNNPTGMVKGGIVKDHGGGVIANSGTLDGVSLWGQLDLGSNLAGVSNLLNIANGLTLAGIDGTGTGTVNLGINNASLVFKGQQTLAAGTINMAAAGNSFLTTESVAGAQLTLGAGTTVNHSLGSAAIGNQYGISAVVNAGTINAASTTAGSTLTIGGTSFTNAGTILVDGVDQLSLVAGAAANQVRLANTGTITVQGGGTLLVGNGSTQNYLWSNTGSIVVGAGSNGKQPKLVLNGTFTTTELEHVSRATPTSGTIAIGGTFDNTGHSFAAGGALGTIVLGYQPPFFGAYGAITGGTVIDDGTGFAFLSATLGNVTWQGTLNLNSSAAGTDNQVTIQTHLALNGSDGTANAGTLAITGTQAVATFQGTQTLDGGTINLGNATAATLRTDFTASSALTLGAGVTLNHTGRFATIGANAANTSYVNAGTINATYGGGNGSFQILGGTFTNSGTITVDNGDSLAIQPVRTGAAANFTNTGTITVAGGGTLTVGSFSNAWSNTGSIQLATGAGGLGGKLVLLGSFTGADLGHVSRATPTTGTISIGGTLDNTGNTLTLGSGAALGSILLGVASGGPPAGTIKGGVLQDSGGGLVSTGNTGGLVTLDGVALHGTLTMTGTANVGLRIVNGITLDGYNGEAGQGVVNVTGNADRLDVVGTTTIAAGTVNLGAATGSAILAQETSAAATLTLGAGVTVNQVGKFGGLGASQNTGHLVNQGTINAGFANGVFEIYGTDFSNTGTLKVGAGGTARVFASSVVNLAANTLTGGSWEAYAGSVLNLVGKPDIVTDAARITLSGAGSSFLTGTNKTLESTLATIAAGGELHVLAGRSWSSSLAMADNGLIELGGGSFTAGSLTIGGTGTLSGFGTVGIAVTDNGLVEATGGKLKLSAAVTGSGTLQIDTGAVLEIATTATMAGGVSFNGINTTLLLDQPATFTATIHNWAPGGAIDLAGTLASAAVLSGTALNVTTGSGPLSYTLDSPIANGRVAVTSDGHGGSLLTLYGYAQPSQHTPEPVDFGNHHVGDAVSQALTLSNLAPSNGYYETLNAAIGTTSPGLAASGSIASLAAGATSTALKVGMLTSTVGQKDGTATITLQTDGTGVDGFGAAALGTQTVHVTGAVYDYADPHLTLPSLDFGTVRLGNAVAARSATLADGTTASPWQESLAYAVGTAPGFVVTNGSGTVASGGKATIGFALDSSVAGDFTGGNVQLGLTSTGLGTSGLADTPLAGQALGLKGKVYAAAVAQLDQPSIYSLGVVHVGDIAKLDAVLSNAATGALVDDLLFTQAALGNPAGFSLTYKPVTLKTGDSTKIGLALDTSTTGQFQSTLDVSSASHNPDMADLAYLNQVFVSGQVNNYAVLGIQASQGTLAHTGNAWTLNLGTLNQVSGLTSVAISFGNVATGLADDLNGTYTLSLDAKASASAFTGFAFKGAGAFDDEQLSINTGSAGSFAETITLHATTGNAGGYAAVLGDITLTVTGTVQAAAFALTPKTDVLLGTQTDDLFAATSADIQTTDQVNGRGGFDTLVLNGGGLFDLRAPALLTNMEAITAVAGTGAAAQEIWLRKGTAWQVTEIPSLADPAAGIAIHGANDTATMNLAAGNDTVWAGSASETIHGGGGDDVFHITAATAAAKIDAGAGTAIVVVEGGGAVTLGGTLVGMDEVWLSDAPVGAPNAVMLASGLGSVALRGSAAGGDTITLGLASQSVISGGAKELVRVQGAAAGALVTGLGASSMLEILTGGTLALNAATGGQDEATRLSVQLDQATTLTLGANPYVAARGSNGADRIIAGASKQVMGGGAGQDQLVGLAGGTTLFRDTAAGFKSDTIVNFGAGSLIDVTDLNFGTATFTTPRMTGTDTTLSLTDGLRSTTITLSGTYYSGFALTSDGTGGTYVSYADPGLVYQLKPVATTIIGTAASETIATTAATLLAADKLDGGGGTDTLALAGGGTFDLRAVGMLANVEAITAQAGLGTATPEIWLRSMMNATLTVIPDAAHPTAGVLVHGAKGSTVMNLGTGDDTVWLGSASDVVHGNGGHDTITMTAATAKASIDAGAEETTLLITGGGQVTLGAVTGADLVARLMDAPGATPYVFTPGAVAKLEIRGTAAGGDTIILGAASQSVTDGGPNEVVRATAATAGALVTGLGAGSTLRIGFGGTATLADGTGGEDAATRLTVQLDAATTLILGSNPFVAACGSAYADTIVAHAAGQVLTGGGGADTLDGVAGGGDLFRDKIANFNGDYLEDFGLGDMIDVTDFGLSGATLKTSLVSLAGGHSLTRVTLTNTALQKAVLQVYDLATHPGASFHLGGDGFGGTDVWYG